MATWPGESSLLATRIRSLWPQIMAHINTSSSPATSVPVRGRAIGIWSLGFAKLLNESSLELIDGKIRAAHELHQTLLPGADLFDRPLDARQPSLRNFHQSVFVPVQEIAGFDLDTENLNGN